MVELVETPAPLVELVETPAPLVELVETPAPDDIDAQHLVIVRCDLEIATW